MTKTLSLILAATAVAAFAGPSLAKAPAKPAAPSHSDCFYGRNLSGFTAVDDSTLLLNVGVRDVYEAKLFSPSTDLRWVNGVALLARGGGNFVCSKMDADIIVPNQVGIGPQRYPVASLRHLTPQEVAAIPKNKRP